MNALGALIEAETTHNVAFLCRVLDVARSSFYTWRADQPAAAQRQFTDDDLASRIHTVHAASRGAYGVPHVHAALRRTGHVINHKRVERIMSERGIRGITRRKYRGLTRPRLRPLTWSNETSMPVSRARNWSDTSPFCPLTGDGGIWRPSSTWPPAK